MVGLQVAAAQIAIKGLAHAINHRGIGLQGHAHPQSVVKHTGNHAPVTGLAGFFFDDAGQNQGLIGVCQLDALGAGLPSAGQLAVHGLHGTAHDAQIRVALAVGIGVWKKPPFCRLARAAQLGHDGFIGLATGQVLQMLRSVQSGAKLAKRPALHQHQGLQGLLATAELLEQIPSRFTVFDFIAPGSQQTRLAAQADEPIKHTGVDLDAAVDAVLGNAAHRSAGLNRQLHHLAGQRQIAQHPSRHGGQAQRDNQ